MKLSSIGLFAVTMVGALANVHGAWCGGHAASSCATCPNDNGVWRGQHWCNGDCLWVNGQCEPKGRAVSCGGHYAKSCQVCPIGDSGAWHANNWCNGQCLWWQGKCENKGSAVNCGGHRASSCTKCPIGDNGQNHANYWCNGQCLWVGGKCVPKGNKVNCGGHKASSCEVCPIGDNGVWHAASWCNGECKWSGGKCVSSKQTPPPEPKGISCGGHKATSCAKCPDDNGVWRGANWCNGECLWWNNQCEPKGKGINCGGHDTTSCEKCPIGDNGVDNGKVWCNGDCLWADGKCKAKGDKVNCGGHKASSCKECPIGESGFWHGDSWCNGDCHWDGSECKDGAAPKPKPKPSASGDPHFETWSGEKYDFHGGCDLVLLQNSHFANGLGLNIHVRTSIRTWWSYIESAIVQIGDDTLQITGGVSSYIINGGHKVELITGDATLGDYAVRFRRINDHQSQTRVDLGNHGDAISIETFKDFVKVNIKDAKKTNFEGSVGMLGLYPYGEKVGRDGQTIFEDTNAFGQEWMVRPGDHVLFQDVDADNFPLQCAMPDAAMIEEKRRRLGEGGVTEEQAAIACSRVDEDHRDTCIFDVMATMDLEMAGSY